MTYTVFQRKGVNNAWEKIIFHPSIFKIETISLNTFWNSFSTVHMGTENH